MKASEVAEGQGLAGEIGGRQAAVYKSGGNLTVLENICTHMGCQTDWNASGQSWDCPCHGSRFNSDGSVLRGPAAEPLPTLAHHIENDGIVID